MSGALANRPTSWSRSQLLFRHASAAIALLEARGIETLVTKGASLAYGDVGARPMDDVDVLVPARAHPRGDRGAG